jgi:hypothetical protein
VVLALLAAHHIFHISRIKVNRRFDVYCEQSARQWYNLWDASYAERQRSNAYNVRFKRVFNLNGRPSVKGFAYPFRLGAMDREYDLDPNCVGGLRERLLSIPSERPAYRDLQGTYAFGGLSR